MMFWMTSKVFQNDFLTNENDDDILNAQYVIASTRIRTKRDSKIDNVINAKGILYPDANVCMSMDADEFKFKYFAQCEASIAFISSLIEGAIKKNYNIIFICTKNEEKMKYLDYFAQYVFLEFEYPVYEYKKFSKGITPIMDYDEKKVLKKCSKHIKEAKKKRRKMLETSSNPNARKSLIKEIKNMNKDELKALSKEYNIYISGMSKKEMIENLKEFI